MNTLSQALIITALGMGLVFATILVLWGLMWAMTGLRLPRRAEKEKVSPETQAEGARQAAAVAVAIALAEQEQSSVHPFPLPQTALVSAWQLGRRTENLNKQGKVR